MNKSDLPNDVEALKSIITGLTQKLGERDQEILRKQEELEGRQREIQDLMDHIREMRRKRFGASSEQVPKEQLGMFDEVEAEALAPEPTEEDEIEIKGHKRKRGGRNAIPEGLPRVEVVLDLSEEEKTCKEDGTALKLVGEEVSEKLEIVPAKLKVVRTIRKKYACPCCQLMKTPPAALEIVPKGLATSSLLAYIATAKYTDALPLYRQEQVFARLGIDLPRQSMARWMIALGEALVPLINLMREKLLESYYVQMDETTVQVLNEEGKAAQSKSYMWVQVRDGPQRIVLFHYAPTRGAEVPEELLTDFKGYLQVDGYNGYDRVCRREGIIRVGCWAHARRRFFEAFKSSQGQKVGKQGLAFIKKLYDVEEKSKDSTVQERFQARQEKARPILSELHAWLKEQQGKVTPTSLAGKAVEYALGEWTPLENYLLSGELKIDNNFAEGRIRPFTIGRKNWLFSSSVDGARASAAIYSVLETAKANGREPYEYLCEILPKLPYAQKLEDFEALLPF